MPTAPSPRKSMLARLLVPGGVGALALIASTLIACVPAAPGPSAVSTAPAATAVAKPVPTAAPARPTEAPKPAAKPTEAPAAKPAAKESPAARPAFDEKAVADFYKGKTVRIIVGAAAGGGFDVYSRAIARYLGRYIPGNPTVIVENMPGAGSIVAANHLYRAAPKDGTAIAVLAGPIVLNQVFGSAGLEFDMAKFNYLNNPTPETRVLVVTKRAGVAKFEDLLGPNSKQLVIGAIPSNATEHAPILLRNLLDANLKIVSGYDGTSKIRQAMDGGEVDGYVTTWESVKISNRQEIESGDWVILVEFEDQPLANLPAGIPRIPTIPDIAKNEEQRLLLTFGVTYPNRLAKVYVLPPETPTDRLAAVEAAFRSTMKDKEFLADAEKAQLDIAPVFGEQIRKMILEMLSMPPNIKARLQELIKL
ncbi:MAG: hypothetical protein HY690_06750 [Chloroflexi bacterium]|nr:hypothetical protein [Chloroflexota bacterium]